MSHPAGSARSAAKWTDAGPGLLLTPITRAACHGTAWMRALPIPWDAPVTQISVPSDIVQTPSRGLVSRRVPETGRRNWSRSEPVRDDELRKPAEQEFVEPFRSIQRNPVAGAGDLLVPPRALDELAGGAHPRAVGPDAERRGGDRGELAARAGHLRGEVSAVPVQRGGQRAGARQVGDRAVDVLVTGGHLAEQGPVLVPECVLRDALELDEQLVPGHLALAHGRGRGRVRHGDRGERPDPVREEHRGEPGYPRAPVVPDDVRRRGVGGVEDRRHVGDRVAQPIAVLAFRAGAAPEAAQIRRYRPESVCGEERDLIAPQRGGIRPAVQQKHRGAVALNIDV